MPVYIFQEANSHYFKIGRTSREIESAERRLRTGNPGPVKLVAQVETDDESSCEAFFHQMLRSKRVHLGGGTEFFEMDPADLHGSVERLQKTFSELKQARAAVQQLSRLPSLPDELDSTAEDRDLLQHLCHLRDMLNTLSVQIELAELKLKQRIGAASGVRGIAVWKTQTRRCYDEALFRERDPDLYQAVLEQYHCVDTSRWKRDRPADYQRVQTTHFKPSISRPFKLLGNGKA